MHINTPQNIILHHSAVSRTLNPNQFTAINNYHKSLGWSKIGYQYLIEPLGEVKPGREEAEVGAHTKEQDMNHKSIGICLTGNFDKEEPTTEQCTALLKLITSLQTKYTIPDAQVYPHRHFATYKSCWGTRLGSDVLGYLRTRLMASGGLPTALEPWQKELYDWAALDITDMKKLLDSNIWSILALIKRKIH